MFRKPKNVRGTKLQYVSIQYKICNSRRPYQEAQDGTDKYDDGHDKKFKEQNFVVTRLESFRVPEM